MVLIAGQVLTDRDDPFAGNGDVGAAAAIPPNDHPPLDHQHLVLAQAVLPFAHSVWHVHRRRHSGG
jgi:hypothetical protein